MNRYYVGQYVNDDNPLAAPFLIRKIARHLLQKEAEALCRARNIEEGHQITNEVELVLSKPTAHYFMYDDERGEK